MHRSELSHVPAEQAFDGGEYGARIARARAAMRDAGIEVMLFHALPDICWLSGYQTPLSDWYACLVLPLEGDPVLQVCDHELAVMNTYVATILPVQWEEMDAAAAQLADHLLRAGAARSRIGIERRRPGLLPHVEAHLRAALPNAAFVDANNLAGPLRAVKSPVEIAAMRRAARLSGIGMAAAVGAIRDGATENDVTAAAMQAIVAAGGEYFAIDPIVRAGPRSGITHATAKRAAIRAGDAVLMEIGGVWQRYCAPLLRTAVIGAPPRRLRELADTSLAAMDALFANLRAGRTAGDVAKAAMAPLARLGPEVSMRGYFGYGVGIAFPPSWVERSIEIAEGRSEVLEPGMTFHLHRVLRTPGVVGAGFSETAVITESGFESLTEFRRELLIV